jgi:hypothetical protein
MNETKNPRDRLCILGFTFVLPHIRILRLYVLVGTFRSIASVRNPDRTRGQTLKATVGTLNEVPHKRLD